MPQSPTKFCDKTPPHWKRPEDVMRLHKLKVKKRALLTRFSGNSPQATNPTTDFSNDAQKSVFNKNPFKRSVPENENENVQSKKSRENVFVAEEKTSSSVDGTLFRLLNFSESSQSQDTLSDSQYSSFTKALTLIKDNKPNATSQDFKKGKIYKPEDLPVDWCLRKRVRLLSPTPFPWNERLKTCEEASGVTGCVRCLDINNAKDQTNFSLDTSPNARFHQCCLYWQHPSLPWLEMFPRMEGVKHFVGSGGSNVSALNLGSFPAVREALYTAWMSSFHTLFQLLRAKQCPYFYVLCNSFTCLFRAAGLGSYSETNALLTPTTRGFRHMLKHENVEFSMPLLSYDRNSGASDGSGSGAQTTPDTGYQSSLDLNCDDDCDDLETDEWLQNMGVEQIEIKRLNNTQVESSMGREKQIDKTPESLIFVEGCETQALFNFLLNCKSIIQTTGPFAGVPPTLLSPVAFTGSSLNSLKVRQSKVTSGGKIYYSLEMRGPILPHTVHNLCDLMKHARLEKFSLTFSDIENTVPLTTTTAQQIEFSPGFSPTKSPLAPSIFGKQNLSDCGLSETALSRFCSRNVQGFDSIKYSDGQFTCI